MSEGLYLSAFLAGVLTLMSPCILPLIPFVASSSLKSNRFGPLFLGLGVVLSFSLTTFLLSRTGQVLGLEPENIKIISGLFLLLSSLLFIFPKITDYISLKLSPLMSRFQDMSTKMSSEKSKRPVLVTEFLSGLMLGPIWTPCSGPTLAVIMGLLASQESTTKAVSLLAFFSIGSLIPLIIISYGAKGIVTKLRNVGLGYAGLIKKSMGVLCLLMSILLLTNMDKKLEAYLLTILPEQIINFSISI